MYLVKCISENEIVYNILDIVTGKLNSVVCSRYIKNISFIC